MKVLIAHNFYRSSSPSGEDVVYEAEVDLFRSRGADVVTYERSNDEIAAHSNGRVAFSAAWSRKAYADISALIREEKPDIAHFHNIWYLISPSAYYACRNSGVPVVQTLHNFRMFCANGLLLRNGRVCEECVGKLPWRGAAYGCFRDSRLYSLPVVGAEMLHQARGTWTNTVDGYIAMTEFGRQKFIQCGLPAEKIYVKPNFLAEPSLPEHSKGAYAMYLGRLSEEKGVNVLLAAADYLERSSSPVRTKIIGDGPLRDRVMQRCADEGLRNIEVTGRKNHAACMELLSHASFLIMPSICYENFPMTIREAFACGKPVIASRLGAMAEIVEDGKTGLLFEPGNAEDLAAKIHWMWENADACIAMGRDARAEFEQKYTADSNFEMLMGIYKQVISKGRR